MCDDSSAERTSLVYMKDKFLRNFYFTDTLDAVPKGIQLYYIISIQALTNMQLKVLVGTLQNASHTKLLRLVIMRLLYLLIFSTVSCKL